MSIFPLLVPLLILSFCSTEDWSITAGATTVPKVEAQYAKWIAGPKSPGLVVLEHELSVQTVQVFMDMYPKIKAAGWQTMSLARINGSAVYQNAEDSTGPVTFVADITEADGQEPASSSSSATPSPSSSSSSSSSSSTTQGSSEKPVATGSVKANGALSFVLESAHWQSQGLLVAFLAVGLSLVSFS